MKKRRTLIISLLLVAALALGIGYAAVSDTLDIIGNIEADGDEMNESFDGKVYFSSADVTEKIGNAKGEAAVSDSNNDTATYGISGLKELNDSATVTFTIKNDYAFDVWVSIPDNHTHETENSIEITSSYTAPIKVEAGKTNTFSITATLKSYTNADISLNHTVTLTASDVDPNA